MFAQEIPGAGPSAEKGGMCIRVRREAGQEGRRNGRSVSGPGFPELAGWVCSLPMTTGP